MPKGPDPALRSRIQRNLDEVRRRIDAACRRAGRSADEVSLVGVTKYASLEEARCLASLGVRDLGENRAHEGEKRRKEISEPVRWHMIGHLQTNKAKRALGWADVLHSLDRPSLAETVDKILNKDNLRLPAYVQLNVSGESAKGGLRPEDAVAWVDELRRSSPRIDLLGLMTMAPYGASPEDLRAIFRRLRGVRDACGLPGLSMGMTADFEIAVEEGSTAVRIGTALFEP